MKLISFISFSNQIAYSNVFGNPSKINYLKLIIKLYITLELLFYILSFRILDAIFHGTKSPFST